MRFHWSGVVSAAGRVFVTECMHQIVFVMQLFGFVLCMVCCVFLGRVVFGSLQITSCCHEVFSSFRIHCICGRVQPAGQSVVVLVLSSVVQRC